MNEQPITEYEGTLSCLVTDIGLERCQEIANHDGWHIYPESFGVADKPGEFSTSRTDFWEPWYKGPLNGHLVRDKNTISFICTLPHDASKEQKDIREVYLYARDNTGDKFVLALGECQSVYSPGEIITLSITVSILNIDAINTFRVVDTCVNDILLHNEDQNAHKDLRDLIANSSEEIIYTEKNNYEAHAGNIIFINASDGPKTIILPKDPINGSRVTVIDSCLIANSNYITITAAKDQRIDGNNVDFVLDAAGAWVTFIWYATRSNWVIDLGGRNITPPSENKSGNFYYSNYFKDTLTRFNANHDYTVGELVVDEHNNMYIATASSGPMYGGTQEPDNSDNTAWVLFANKKVIKYINGASKGIPIFITPYIKGKNNISVYIDGIRCSCGNDPNKDTFYEESVANGTKCSRIYFHDDIPYDFEITIVRE